MRNEYVPPAELRMHDGLNLDLHCRLLALSMAEVLQDSVGDSVGDEVHAYYR